MHPQPSTTSNSDAPRRYSKTENAILFYNSVMMVVIVLNVLGLFLDRFLMSDLGQTFFEVIQLHQAGLDYRQFWHPQVMQVEAYFTGYLIVELFVRWAANIRQQKSNERWYFFPFIRFYEVLAILPDLRFLRLVRVGMIARELKEHDIRLWPVFLEDFVKDNFFRLKEVVTDTIVLTALEHLKLELKHVHYDKVDPVHDHYQYAYKLLIPEIKTHMTQTLSEFLQQNLATALHAQQQHIVKGVGLVVHQAIAETPELTQLLRLIPIVGTRIEQQIQSIGQRLGENIAQGLLQPFNHPELSKTTYNEISQHIMAAQLNHSPIEKLLSDSIEQSIELIGVQVKKDLIRELNRQHVAAESPAQPVPH